MLSWYNTEETIIYIAFDADYTCADFMTASIKAVGMAYAKQHPVYCVMDFTACAGIPEGCLGHMQGAVSHSPSNLLLTVGVGDAGYIRTMLGMLSGTFKLPAKRFHVAATVDEALATITEQAALLTDARTVRCSR